MHRNEEENPRSKIDLITSLFIASSYATLVTHPLRVLMNIAPYQSNPWQTLKQLPQHWRTGLGINLVRGVSAVTLQAYAREEALMYWNHSTFGKVMGWAAATCAGTAIACSIEVPFMRLSNIKPGQIVPLFRFSPQLLLLFGLRESAFNGLVVCKSSIPPEHFPYAWLAAGVVSAPSHKFATWDATADIKAKAGEMTPSFKRDGFFNTIRNIAYGRYHFDSFYVPFKHPTQYRHLVGNFFYVGCHPNMLFFRMLLLGAYSMCLDQGKSSAPSVKNQTSTFFKDRIKHIEKINEWEPPEP